MLFTVRKNTFLYSKKLNILIFCQTKHFAAYKRANIPVLQAASSDFCYITVISNVWFCKKSMRLLPASAKHQQSSSFRNHTLQLRFLSFRYNIIIFVFQSNCVRYLSEQRLFHLCTCKILILKITDLQTVFRRRNYLCCCPMNRDGSSLYMVLQSQYHPIQML